MKFIVVVLFCFILSSCGLDPGSNFDGRASSVVSGVGSESGLSCLYLNDSLYSMCTKFDSSGYLDVVDVASVNGELIYSARFDSSGGIINDSGMPAVYNAPKKNVDLCKGDSIEFVFRAFRVAEMDALIRKVEYFREGVGSVELANDTISFIETFRFKCQFGYGEIDRFHVSIKGLDTKSQKIYGSASYIDEFHLSDCDLRP